MSPGGCGSGPWGTSDHQVRRTVSRRLTPVSPVADKDGQPVPSLSPAASMRTIAYVPQMSPARPPDVPYLSVARGEMLDPRHFRDAMCLSHRDWIGDTNWQRIGRDRDILERKQARGEQGFHIAALARTNSVSPGRYA